MLDQFMIVHRCKAVQKLKSENNAKGVSWPRSAEGMCSHIKWFYLAIEEGGE